VALVWLIPAIILGFLFNLGDSFILTLLARIILALATAFLLAAIVPVALTGTIAEGLNFQVVVNRVMSNLGDYVIILAIGLIVSVISSFGLIGACLGFLIFLFYAWLVQSHLAAQAYVRSTGGQIPPKQAF
jgi:hypothetical protein